MWPNSNNYSTEGVDNMWGQLRACLTSTDSKGNVHKTSVIYKLTVIYKLAVTNTNFKST